MIAGILSIFGSPLLGTLTGFFGSWLTKREERKSLELTQNHAIEIAKLTHEQKVEYTKIEGDIEVQTTDAASFQEAVKATKISSGNGFFDGLKSLIRPVITIYLLIGMTIITIEIHQLIGGLATLPVEELTEIYARIISECLYFTSVAISFWLGIRPGQKRKE